MIGNSAYWIVAALCLPAGLVQHAPVALSDLAVDQVNLKHGPRLLGGVIDRGKDGTVTMAVSREWLQTAHPKFYEARLASEQTEQHAVFEQLHERIETWLKERADHQELVFFLKKEAERVSKALAAQQNKPAENQSEFMLIELTAAEVDRVVVQPPARKQVALVAWREQLADVEKRSVASLTRELQKSKIDPAKERVDLSDRLAGRRQSEAEWKARQAIVEYQYLKPLDFQGTGDLVVKTGDGEKGPDLAAMLPKLIQSQLGDQFADLLGEPGKPKPRPEKTDWLKSAVRTAEQDEVAGFRVTRVKPNTDLRQVTVETRFVARLSGDQWETVWLDIETVDASKPNKDLVDRIANDPQIKPILELAKVAGLGGGEEALQSALKFGAATMQAQETANARFAEFRERYLRRLEGPPLTWNK